jgi:hypothetical protein
MVRIAVAVFSAVIALSTVLSPTLLAQEQPDSVSTAGLTVSPAIFEVVGKLGQTVKKDFYIQNISDHTLPVTAAMDRLHPYEVEVDPGESESFNAAQWVKISEPHHILKTDERRKVTATISVPKNAEPGGHYATILWQPMAQIFQQEGNTAKIAPKVGILVFITVPGNAEYTVDLSNNASGLYWSKNIPITSEFTNTGTIHILPTPKVVVRNIFGGVEEELELKPSVVLPNTIKMFPTEWKGANLLGVYSAETMATFSPSQTPISSSRQYFVVIRPLPLLLVIALTYLLGNFVRKTSPHWPEAIRAFRNAGKKQK